MTPSTDLPAAIVEEFSVDFGYFDTASVGAPPNVAGEALFRALSAWQHGRARAQDYDEYVARSRAAYSRLVGVSADEVAIGSQASALMGLIAGSLPDNAKVVAVEGDFTSAIFPFMAHASRGVEVRLVPLDKLADAIDEATSMVVLSAVQSSDGSVADLAAIAAAAAVHGTRTVLDTTQSCGWLPLAASSFDVTICAAYKWLLSPRGTAFMTVKPEMLPSIRPLSAGWYAGEDVWTSIYGGPLRLAQSARRLDVSPAWLCWVGTAPALELIERVGVEAIHHHNVGLANRVRRGLGLPESNSAIVRIESAAAPTLLAAADLRASMRAGAVRVGFHLYNTVAEADRLVDVLSDVAM